MRNHHSEDYTDYNDDFYREKTKAARFIHKKDYLKEQFQEDILETELELHDRKDIDIEKILKKFK